ncbi:MAG TPA: GNAT family N-acetyltransferase [Solirubrobacteraceae bacterium]|nr:GNAT family N-acetyltransferase [Solirubrobacteraceae bacterium]
MTTRERSYEIRVEGHLDDHWSAWLGGLDMTRDDDGATTVFVQVADQAQLHGVLTGLRDIGAVISELRTRDAPVPIRRSVLERPLHTERLILRPATGEDADPTWRLRRLEPVEEWLTGCPADLDGYRARFSEPGRLATTVIVALGQDAAAPIIGDFRLDVAVQARDTRAELGCVLDPAYAGHGYAAEAVRELLRYCFRDLGVRRVTASCLVDDDRARSLLERVGMRPGTVGYAVLEEDWSPA